MKIYVAGVAFVDDIIPAVDKTKALISQLKIIHENGTKKLGKDVTVFIVLPEYEITCVPIKENRYRTIVKNLQIAMSQYPNMILVPGSLSTVQTFSDYEKNKVKTITSKLDKIANNYSGTFSFLQKQNINDTQFDKHKLQLENACTTNIKEEPYDKADYFLLRNVSFFLTSESSIKFKKSFPFNEEMKLVSGNRDRVVYNAGDRQSITEVTVNDTKFNMGLYICRDIVHVNKEVVSERPLVQIVISASITIEDLNKIGAAVIHINRNDTKATLNVYLNDSHPERNKIETIVADLYEIKKNNMSEIQSITTEEIDDKKIDQIRMEEKNYYSKNQKSYIDKMYEDYLNDDSGENNNNYDYCSNFNSYGKNNN